MAIIKLDGGYNALPISYKRGNPIPLDTTAVWYDLESLQAYARTGVTAYVGQVLSLVSEIKDDAGEVIGHTSTAYIIADTNGTLEPIGTAPIGDDKSIVVAEDGTVSRAGIDALDFEQDIIGEDGQPTGEKEEVQFQPLMTKNGLVWVVPSKTTVEGLASLIDALTLRVKALEDDRVTESELADAIKDFATDTEVAAAVKAETDRATAAEEALGKRIDAIDFVDESELATALATYAKTEDVTSGLATKADKDAYDQTVLDLTALKGRVEAFLDNTGAATEAIDTLQDLITFINTHDDVEIADILADIQAIENKLVLGTYTEGEETKEYTTVKAYVEAAIEAIKIGDYAKAADLTELAGRVEVLEAKPFDTYATKDEVKAVDDKFAAKANTADVVSKSDFEEFQTANTEAIGAARSGAVADVAEVGYALASDVVSNSDFNTFKGENTAAIETAAAGAKSDAVTEIVNKGYAVATEVAETYATKEELDRQTELADEKYATKQFVGSIPTGYTESTVIGYVNKKAQEVLEAATGGSQESAASVKLQLDNYKAANDPKVTALLNEVYGPIPDGKDAHDYTASSRIDVNTQNIALNAKSISDVALLINGESGLASQIAAIYTELSTDIDPRISALEGTATQHTTSIGANTTAIATLNNETIPAIQQAIADGDKAITDKIGTVTEGKTVVDMINAVAGTIDFTPYAKTADVASTYATIAALEGIYKAGEGDAAATGILADEIARAKAAEEKIAGDLALLIENPTEALDSVKELIEHVTEHGTDIAGVITRLDGHDTAIANNKAAHEKNASDIVAINALIAANEVKESSEISVTAMGDDATGVQLGIKEVNVNKLVQTAGDTLVLNGGSATVQA